jgi:uncharacterized protein YeaO (DUF488 family)
VLTASIRHGVYAGDVMKFTSRSQTMFRTKSFFSPIKRRTDGLRILATRFRGRGLPVDLYDVWMANLGPSERLLRQFWSGAISWGDFTRRYRKELFEDGDFDRRNKTIKNHGQKFTLRLLQELARHTPITLMCHCDEDQQQCHRHVLRKILEGHV